MKATLHQEILQVLSEGFKSISELDKMGDKPNQGRLVVSHLQSKGYVEVRQQRVIITSAGRHYLVSSTGQPEYAVARARQINKMAGNYVPPTWHTRAGSEQARSVPSLMFGREHHA